MKHFDYESLSVLAAVVREGSFDSAARSLNITQSAVSQRIKTLEEKAGALLIIRGRPCLPTEIGKKLCGHVDKVSLLQHELVKELNVLAGEPAGKAATVKLSVNNDSLATWFPAVIRRASQELNILFEFITNDQEHTENDLKSGEALAVVSSSDAIIQGIRQIPLGTMDYVAVAAPDFFQENFAEGVSAETLSGTTCLAYDRKDTIQDQWMMLCFGKSVPLLAHMVPSYEGYLACCLNGTAWGLVPKPALSRYLKDGSLIEMTPGKAVTVPLHWHAGSQSSNVMQRLGDLVLEEALHALDRIGGPNP